MSQKYKRRPRRLQRRMSGRKPYKVLEQSDIHDLENGKISVKQLSEKLGITLNALYHKIHKQGIKLKPAFRQSRIQERSILRFERMIRFREQGLSYRQIALKYRLTHQTVMGIVNSKRLREAHEKYLESHWEKPSGRRLSN